MNTTKTDSINPVRPSELIGMAEMAITGNKFLFILGSGGAGKTSIVSQIMAPALGRELWEVNLNGQGPQEVIGYGKPEERGTELDMRFAAPDIWPTLGRVGARPVLLFLDECNDYDPAVQALLRSLYPASGYRKVGPHKLGSDVLVVCASNRRVDGTRAVVEAAPFTERTIKCTLEPHLGDWLDWYDTQLLLMSSGSHVPAFLKFGTTTGDGVDHFNPPIVMPYDGVPHPCPRTWETVVLIEPFRKTRPELFIKGVRGSVGDRTACAYAAFLQHVDKVPEIEYLKANYKSYKVSASPAEQYALVSACLATASRGVSDCGAAVHSGGFDWLVHLLLQCRGDIREYGALSADRRGIPLCEHSRSNDLIVS